MFDGRVLVAWCFSYSKKINCTITICKIAHYILYFPNSGLWDGGTFDQTLGAKQRAVPLVVD
jgi:hypothetical protein